MEDQKAARATTKKYRYSQRQAVLFPNAVTLVPVDLSEPMGLPNQELVSVALSGVSYEHTIPPNAGGPGGKVTVPGATQAQLAYIFKQGNAHIQEYEE